MNNYSDENHITDDDIKHLQDLTDAGKITEASDLVSAWLSHKIHGKDVRQALCEWVKLTAKTFENFSEDEKKFKELETNFAKKSPYATLLDFQEFKDEFNKEQNEKINHLITGKDRDAIEGAVRTVLNERIDQ